MKIAYLGPEASFTQLAALHIFDKSQLLAYSNIPYCFDAVQNDIAAKAIIPLENSIEGTISLTLDYLYASENIEIEAEVIMPIAHHLMIAPDNTTFDKIISHPQALAQTYHYREKFYPNIPTQDYHSTSASAKLVAENPNEKWAAIANHHAAQLYGLKIVAVNLQDFDQNHTKFIVISKSKETIHLEVEKIAEKTSLIITLPEDHPGGLHQALSVFAWRKMNLSKIESRTLKTGLGNYFFFINVENKWDNVLFDNALQELQCIGAEVKFLGHYNEYLLSE